MKFIYIRITHYGANDVKSHVFFDDGENEPTNLTYEEGMRQLRLLERATGRCAEMEINAFDPAICTKTLCGWV